MNQARIQQNIQHLIDNFNRESFIYDLLLAYGLPKASITRLRKGNLNLASATGEISWKRKLFFKEANGDDLHLTISQFTESIKHDQRFVVVTDYRTLLAIDTKTDDKLDVPLNELPGHYDFFLPSINMKLTKPVLNKFGIKLFLIPKLEKTPVDGFSFWSDENPAVAITLRHKRIDNFAFTLMHEIAHIRIF